MKYICQKLVLFTFCVPFYCFSQITINSSNLPNINDTVVTAYDFANYSAGTAGGSGGGAEGPGNSGGAGTSCQGNPGGDVVSPVPEVVSCPVAT